MPHPDPATRDPWALATDPGRDPRVLRYLLQSTARSILHTRQPYAYNLRDADDRARYNLDHPWRKINMCHRVPINKSNPVRLMRTADGQTPTAYLAGHLACGYAGCPVCLGALADRRAIELSEAVNAHRSDGGGLAMLTLTCRHDSSMPLADLLQRLQSARDNLLRGDAWGYTQRALGVPLLGQFRALETTFSRQSGWHPHYHILFFLGAPLLPMHNAAMAPWYPDHPAPLPQANESGAVGYLQSFFERRWVGCLQAVGLSGLGSIAAQVEDATSDIAPYLTKAGLSDGRWDITKELTRASTKRARGDGLTANDLLGVAYAHWIADGLTETARDRYREYANALRDRRTHVYQWGRNTRCRLALAPEATTEESVSGAANDRSLRLLAVLSPPHWRCIVAHGLQGHLLELAATHTPKSILAYLRHYDEDLPDFSDPNETEPSQ